MLISEMTPRQTRLLKRISFLVQCIIVYTAIHFFYAAGLLSDKLFALIVCFFDLMFALYYGIKGTIAAVAGTFLLLLLNVPGEFIPFLSRHYMEASFMAATLFIAGFARTHIEQKLVGSETVKELSDRRIEKLTVELSETNKALQDMFRETLTDMSSPNILYQALRRLEKIDEKDLFREFLEILYTHCHVEKSSVYRVVGINRFQRVALFGDTELPGILTWRSDDMPEIIRIARVKKEVIIPKQLDHRFVMVMPVLSSLDELLYLVLIEEVRFINFSEALIDLLKLTLFWVKYIIEERFDRKKRLSLSIYPSVIVYRPDVAADRLQMSISRHRTYGLSFELLNVRGPITEEKAIGLSRLLRLYDELFLIHSGELIILLSMANRKNIGLVIRRLKQSYPDLTIKRTTNPEAFPWPDISSRSGA